jgi:putative ABC transport system permease protein
VTFGRVVARDLARNPLRLGLTVVAATVGVLAFVFLQTVIDLWYSGVEHAAIDRLAVRNKTSLTQTLPLSYLRRIEAVPGISEVTFGGWFGGMKSESQKDFYPNFFVDSASYLKVFSEYVVPPEQAAAWRADPCGALIGHDLAARFGWKPGDLISLKGTIYPGTWDFTVRGVFAGKDPTVDTRGMAFDFRCLNERVAPEEKDRVGFFTVRVDDPSRSAAVAAAIDSMFANSPNETKTESEKAFQLGFVAMSGAILAAVRIVSYVVLFIMLLVVSNTIAMSVREKTVELSTLRALGFRTRYLVALVLGESTTIGAAAAVLGLLASPAVLHVFSRVVAKSFGAFPPAVIRADTALLAVAMSLFVGIAAGVVPARMAARLEVAEGLRREI